MCVNWHKSKLSIGVCGLMTTAANIHFNHCLVTKMWVNISGGEGRGVDDGNLNQINREFIDSNNTFDLVKNNVFNSNSLQFVVVSSCYRATQVRFISCGLEVKWTIV